MNILKIKKTFTLFIVLSLVLIQCKKNESVPSSEKNNNPISDILVSDEKKEDDKKEDAEEKPNVPDVVIPRKDFGYYPWVYKNNDSVSQKNKKEFTGKALYTILALNRLDKANIGRADTLVVPAKIEDDFLRYSPFPGHVTSLENVKKFVFFSYPIQAFGVYEYGNLIKWGPTSMGKKATPTKKGLMFANWKKEVAISTVSDEWKLRWNVNIANFDGIGWHQYSMPGYPASHSCLRMLEEDAKWMYGWVDTWVLNKGGQSTRAKGTPVIVYGDYPWGQRRPWKKLLDSPDANNMSEDAMNKIIEPQLAQIMKEQDNRDAVIQQIEQEKKAKADSLSSVKNQLSANLN
ncbi:L,D-transpeptidase catalytic domain [Epilithonimonas bovis DSM 19482]|uniref:L,D-transpeptidase catalytic domain n=1 Tax=Epilithonimonas bovis DSM 19482 TaxID=1121284 RepID=A0A1U7Q0N5_9FLAO|nr:L,D-transpeptidase [Epilithonimonas bovis]SIT99034.1 L,D-transpeptidase catalytic domain [Epilithonimonas bovis DSM 19482]